MTLAQRLAIRKARTQRAEARSERAERLMGLMRQRRTGDLLAAITLDAKWDRAVQAALRAEGM